MSIEDIALEHYSELPKEDINSTTPSRQSHTVFNYFRSNDSKHDDANTTAHRKHLISFPKEKKVMTT